MHSIVGAFREKVVFGRRVRVLAGHLVELIPRGARILDVGCGDGTLDSLILQTRPDVTIEGIDVLPWAQAKIRVKQFDGSHIPYEDDSFDMVMFVDVLHHTTDPVVLLNEASRVGKSVLIKDHFQNGLFAHQTLKFMDWVGNAHHGVSLPYNYSSRDRWNAMFKQVGLKPTATKSSLGLYPPPASWVFGRGLHFVGRFERSGKAEPVSAPLAAASV
jgi:SAM-dependent methyltransferase